MASQFGVQPADFSLGLNTAMSGIVKGAEAKQERVRSDEDTAMMEDFAAQMETMTPVEVGQFILKNPRISKQITSALDVSQKLTKEENLQQAYSIARAFITGESSTPPEAPPTPPAPSIGLDTAPIGQTPMQPPVDQTMVAPTGQTPMVDEERGSPAQQEAVKVLTERAELVMERGGDAKDSIEGIRDTMTGGEKAFKGAMAVIASQDPQGFNSLMKLVDDGETGGTYTNEKQYADLIEQQYEMDNPGQKMPPGEKALAMKDFKRANSSEAQAVMLAKLEAKLELEPQIKSAVTEAEKEASRGQSVITKGLDSAEAMPLLNRTVDLLEQVKTGGWRSIDLALRQKLGIEGANEGELNNSMGKAVLTQLRATFGAAFTFGEGQSLKDLEAGFSKSNATNLRLIKRIMRTSKLSISQARARAVENGDEATVAELDQFMGLSLAPNAEAPPEITTEAEYNALAPGAFYLEDGKRYQKPGRQ